MNYFLLKSEPSCYSIDTLKKDKTTSWTGVRNYQARNIMRDSMKPGDLCFFYHSNCCENTGIVGLMRVASDAMPDMTALDITHEHFDQKSTIQNPIWITREMDFVQKFDTILSLKGIKENPLLSDMTVAQKGSRLSVQVVSKKHFGILMRILEK